MDRFSCVIIYPIPILVPCGAQDLYKSASVNLSGPVDFRHTFVDMSNVAVTINGSEVSPLCVAVLGQHCLQSQCPRQHWCILYIVRT